MRGQPDFPLSLEGSVPILKANNSLSNANSPCAVLGLKNVEIFHNTGLCVEALSIPVLAEVSHALYESLNGVPGVSSSVEPKM